MQVNDVEAAIKGMLDGTVKPEDVRIEGIESEEEKAQKQKAREDRQRVQAEKDRVLNEQRKTEERERWWAGVEIFKPRNEPLTSVVTVSSANDDAEAKKEAIVNRYTADYSRWNEWTPTDEATLAETAEANRLVEEAKNKEFEKNNAEFCNQFLTDMNERKKVTEKKQGSADISRLKGNRYFKAKAWAKALDSYMEALRESPFDAKTVNNIAQVCFQLSFLFLLRLSRCVACAGAHQDEGLRRRLGVPAPHALSGVHQHQGAAHPIESSIFCMYANEV